MRRGCTGILLSAALFLEGCGIYQKAFPPEKEALQKEITSLEEQVNELSNTLSERKYRLRILEEGPGLKEKGYHPSHAVSCGPESLSTLLKRFGEKIDAKDISREILQHGHVYNFARNFLGWFHQDLIEITFPEEIKNVLQRREYAVKSTQGNQEEMLKTLAAMTEKGAAGIVRLKQESGFAQHYEPFPPAITEKSERGKKIIEYIDIPAYFGKENTMIVEIYEIEKKK